MEKTFKDYCRDAKKRLKNGFWENYHKNLSAKILSAEKNGVSTTNVKEYFTNIAKKEIKNVDDDSEAFYLKVKKILTEEGEVSNAIGRLTDKEYYDTLDYEGKQRYNLSLSEKYLKAVERFKKEKEVENS